MDFFKSDLFIIGLSFFLFVGFVILIAAKSVREWVLKHWFIIFMCASGMCALILLMGGVTAFFQALPQIRCVLDWLKSPYVWAMVIAGAVLLFLRKKGSGPASTLWKDLGRGALAFGLLVLFLLALYYLATGGSANMVKRTLAMVETNRLLDEQRQASSQFQTENSQDSQSPSAPPSTQERSNENTSDATHQTQECQNFRSPTPAVPSRNLRCYQQPLADKSGYVQLQSRPPYAAQPPPCKRSSEGFRMSNPAYYSHHGYTVVSARMHHRDTHPLHAKYYPD
jgi:hypothetical protein